MRIPTLKDVYKARQIVDRYLPRTPLIPSPVLSEKLGCELYLKCENLQPIGAFKIRGGINLLANLPESIRQRGVVGCSTGNHGQSIAWAARQFNTRAVIYMPEISNPVKVESMLRLGAEVVFEGHDFDAARLAAEARAEAEGLYYVHSANEARLIEGVGTYALEILETVPDLDYLFVPIGAGSGACGSVIAGKGINPDLKVIGVQAAGAPVVHDSVKAGQLLSYDTMATFAEGLATRVAFELPVRIMREGIDDIVLVTDAEMRQALVTLLFSHRLLAEGAGAASLAAARNLADTLRGKKVAAVISGGNFPQDALRQALDEERPW
ncbi:MAG: threonine/serine dehydratase [Thermomicrobiales bacterium]|nr:threonine/serine dehydratase [Thermomicrobiales bacterium]